MVEASTEDRRVPIEGVLDALVDRLSLEQKVRLVSGADWWSTCAEPAIGLGRIVVSDGPSGVRGVVGDERDPSVCLPSSTALAATWDEGLVARLAELLAAEARRKGVHVVLGPTLNLHRSPRGGRHFECFSEDPLLTSRIGRAYVRALQSFGIGACPKHYVANDSETDRFTVDVRVDERTLRELYLAPFAQVVEAGAWSMMAAYNGVNGHTMTEHPLLGEPLKGEWGFDSVVISDWFALRSTEAAGAAGTDLAMPGPSEVWGAPLVAAIRAGRVPEAAIDDKVRRILRLAARVGVLDGVRPPAAAAPEAADTAGLLRHAAASSMVLLRNEDRLLPLRRDRLRRIAVIGPYAADPQIQGGGSVEVVPTYAVSPLDGLREAVADTVEVIHQVGVSHPDGLLPAPVEMLTNPIAGAQGLHVRFLDGNGDEVRTENRHAAQFVWLAEELTDVATIEIRTRLRARSSGVHLIGAAGGGSDRRPGYYRLDVGGQVLVDEAIAVEAGGQPVETTDAPPRTLEVNLASDQEIDVVLTHRVPPGAPAAVLTLGIEEPSASPAELMDAAVTAAKAADAVVVVVGTGASEREGQDRSTLALPGQQNELVQAVAAVNPRTIVVVNSGAPVELAWHTDVAAILLAWFPGQEFGHALADVLFGEREPGGRLPTTWAVDETDVPVLDTRPRDGHLDYDEGLHIGYRAWARTSMTPAYPFGHGLGYTTWDYQSIQAPDHITPGQIAAGQPTTVRIRLANVGDRPGREVVQVYLQRPGSALDRPTLWLAGFTSVKANPGHEVDVDVELAARAFQHWSTESNQWETEPGAFAVLAGHSAADLPLHATLNTTDPPT